MVGLWVLTIGTVLATAVMALEVRGSFADQLRVEFRGATVNLGNLVRRLVLPVAIQNWSLTNLQQRLFKTGRTPHSTCAVLRASTGRKSLDRESLSADPPAHRGAEVPPGLIERTAPIWEQAGDAGGSLSEAGEAASGGPWNMRNPKRGCRENVRGTDQEWPGDLVRRHMVRSVAA